MRSKANRLAGRHEKRRRRRRMKEPERDGV